MNRVEAHVFAGLGGWLFASGTKALDKLMDDLSPVWDANHWYHGQWEKACDGIIARQKFHKDKPTVILIGHSYGALRCQQIAVRLKSHKMDVAYIGCIDATALPYGHPPMVVPNNVAKVDEFWATSGFPASARRRDPSGKSGGRYIYPSDWPGAVNMVRVPGGHVPCASDPKTRAVILKSVKAVLA